MQISHKKNIYTLQILKNFSLSALLLHFKSGQLNYPITKTTFLYMQFSAFSKLWISLFISTQWTNQKGSPSVFKGAPELHFRWATKACISLVFDCNKYQVFNSKVCEKVKKKTNSMRCFLSKKEKKYSWIYKHICSKSSLFLLDVSFFAPFPASMHTVMSIFQRNCSHWGIRQSGQIFSVAYCKQLLFKGRVMRVCILQRDIYVNTLLLAISKI